MRIVWLNKLLRRKGRIRSKDLRLIEHLKNSAEGYAEGIKTYALFRSIQSTSLKMSRETFIKWLNENVEINIKS